MTMTLFTRCIRRQSSNWLKEDSIYVSLLLTHLGVNWNFVEDQLVFDLSNIAELAKSCKPTKQNVVRLSTKFYDPLGYISPITVQLKHLFQSCESKVGWDDEISHLIKVKWERLVAELLKMKRILLPRCCFYNISEKVISSTIHGFCERQGWHTQR